VVPMMPDSINAETDRILDKVRNNEELFRYVLGLCYGHFADLANKVVGMDAVFVYFAEKHFLPNATWVEKKIADNIRADIAKIKPNLIGNPAPALQLIDVPTDHFLIAKTDTAVRSSTQIGSLLALQDIKASFLVLAFWEADCGHCIKEMPVLYDSVFPRIKEKGVKIVAIQLISSVDNKRKWVDFVNQHKMYDWMNAVPYGMDYKELFNVYSTPTIYLLDENKKIIAKKISVEQIESMIDFEIRKKKDTTANK
jgi:thiol-disulfide isomerase/thioredoxin